MASSPLSQHLSESDKAFLTAKTWQEIRDFSGSLAVASNQEAENLSSHATTSDLEDLLELRYGAGADTSQDTRAQIIKIATIFNITALSLMIICVLFILISFVLCLLYQHLLQESFLHLFQNLAAPRFANESSSRCHKVSL